MNKVKLFIGHHFIEKDINAWVKERNVEVVGTSMTIRKYDGLEDSIYVMVTYKEI